MVEFVKKTIAIKDCTLDSTYSDLYDGNNPYLKVGGIVEPKKAILRFQIAAKPTFGDAELSSGEVGIYSTDLRLGTSVNFPTFNVYKIKTSSDGRDWGGDGRIRTITRGKQIEGVDKRDEDEDDAGIYYHSVKVINHELSTGDRVWWSPVIVRYDDCSIDGLIPEVEYYAIKIDKDNFSFASSIANAIAGTRIDLTDYSATTSWGYIRSEKFNMDIHVISATPSTDREVLSENFNGSPYRESDLEFEYVQRTITRRGEPYLTSPDGLQDNPYSGGADWGWGKGKQGNEGGNRFWTIGAVGAETPANLKKWYGNGEDGDAFKIWLTSHKTNSSGGGWWRTIEDAGKWGGGHDYIAKGSSSVQFDHETNAEPEPYGDEVTPENCFFHVVKGAAEFQEASDSEDGENEVQATGAIRLSTKKVLTGGQSCNIYQFWKLDGLGIAYHTGEEIGGVKHDFIVGKKDRQECMMLYKGLPLPNRNWTLIDKGTHGHGQLPWENDEITAEDSGALMSVGAGDMCVSMTVNFEKLEMAYTHLPQSSVTNVTSDITLRRGFHVIYAAKPPDHGESLYSYIKRLSGFAVGHPTGNGSLVSADPLGSSTVEQISACGYSIINTSGGIVLYPLDRMRIDTVDNNIYIANVNHTDGKNLPDKATPSITYMEEGEWYTIKTFFPEEANQQAALIIEDSEGEPRHYVADGSFWEDNPIPLNNIKHISNVSKKPWHSKNATQVMAKEWYQHMSIWVTNVESAYSTGSVVSGGNHPGTDWMASEDDRDTSNNIFIDRIGVTGVNLDHENATVGQEGRSRSKIFITGNKTYDSVSAGTVDLTAAGGEAKYSSDTRSRRADNLICLGFEDPSQILSTYTREKSWRYLFWHGYTSANIGADNKIGWTSDDTLPDRTYALPGSGEEEQNEWFSTMPDNQYRSTGFKDHEDSHMEVLDAGAPYTFSEELGGLRNSVVAFYSDNHVSLGTQFSDESLDIRELWRNHTKDDNADHRKGAKQSMYKSVPSLGALFDSDEIAGDGLITIKRGPKNTTLATNDYAIGTYWNSGQKLIYFNAGFSSLAYTNGEGGNLESGNGNFNDIPKIYYWERNDSDTTGYLHISYNEAIAGLSGTRLDITASSASPNEIQYLYDYDYYMNRKYWIDGWSSKGLSRLILEPVGPYTIGASAVTSLNRKFLDTDELPPVIAQDDDEDTLQDSLDTPLANAPIVDLQLTKREHVGCAAKILEIPDDNVSVSTGASGASNAYLCRVDSTEMLRSTPNTTYRIFFAASPNTTANYAAGLSINIVDEEHIEILDWDGKSDTGVVMTQKVQGAAGAPELSAGLCRAWIGPEKYWVSFLIRNQSGDSSDTFGNLPLKSYSTVSVCSPFGSAGDTNEREHRDVAGLYDAWGVPGATYNEFLYNADNVSGVRGAYINQWSPSPNLDPNLTIYDLQDFGFGAAKEDKDGLGGENGVVGGYVGRFIPRQSQVNRIRMPKVFSVGEVKVEEDYIDLAIQQETLSSDAIMTMASTDNGAYPTPFLLTVFEDDIPEAPVDFEVEPNEKDAFLPEFTWTASDADLWYGFILIDDTPVSNQYHGSVLHVPLNEDLSALVSSYDDVKGWYYSDSSNPAVYAYRYYNTNNVPSGVHAGSALASAGTDKILATSATLYDNVEGLAGNTKYFEASIGSHVQLPFDDTAGSSGFTYPVDEMSVLVHITPESWAIDADTPRYIAAFNNPVGSAADTKATATITVTNVDLIDHNDSFNIVDTEGIIHVFTFKTSGNDVTGNEIGIQTAKAASDDVAASYQVWASIEAGTTASKITAVHTASPVVNLTQDVAGGEGNRNSLILAGATGYTVGNFSGAYSVEPSWGLHLDENGQINAFVGAAAAAKPPATNDGRIALKSTTKVLVDGTPTCIILTVDTQLHSGNVKLYINGRLEDQTGLRLTTQTVNNWPTDASGLGGENIFYDTDGIEDLFIGAKSVTTVADWRGDLTALESRFSFQGKIEEFVWYDKAIHPIIPQNGTFTLDKPLEELASSAINASSKSYTARLFIKDYHNIRGKTSGEVAASSQISFKKAAFELYT